VNCEDDGIEYAKRRQMTCGSADRVDGINMHTPLAAIVGAADDTCSISVELRGLEPQP